MTEVGKKRLTFLYQADRCIGCRACQAACKSVHHLPAGLFFRRVMTWETTDWEGHPGLLPFSGACNHCADPDCVRSCPTGAMYVAEDGTVRHREGICMACGCCVSACPYGAPVISPYAGKAQKCDLCASLREDGKDPACIAACLTYALTLAEVGEEVLSESVDPPAYRAVLPDRALTNPAYLIRGKDDPEIRRL